MTPLDAKRAADELIAAANAKAKARLIAAGEKRARAKENALRPEYLEKIREIERQMAATNEEYDKEFMEYIES